MINIDGLLSGLREIDNHIRSTPDPIPCIVDTLKRVLPEYREMPDRADCDHKNPDGSWSVAIVDGQYEQCTRCGLMGK